MEASLLFSFFASFLSLEHYCLGPVKNCRSGEKDWQSLLGPRAGNWVNLGKCGEEVLESLFMNSFLKDNLRRYIEVNTLRSMCLGRQLYLGQLALCAQHLFLIEKHDLFTHATPGFKKNFTSVHFAFLVNTSFFFNYYFSLEERSSHICMFCVFWKSWPWKNITCSCFYVYTWVLGHCVLWLLLSLINLLKVQHFLCLIKV